MDMHVATIGPPVTGGSPPGNRRRLSWKLAVAVLIVAGAIAIAWWLLRGPAITVARVTRGELFAIMACGMASIAGTVLFLYASILRDALPDAVASSR